MRLDSRGALLACIALTGCSILTDFEEPVFENDPVACRDRVDNDGDGRTDCEDDDCACNRCGEFVEEPPESDALGQLCARDCECPAGLVCVRDAVEIVTERATAAGARCVAPIPAAPLRPTFTPCPPNWTVESNPGRPTTCAPPTGRDVVCDGAWQPQPSLDRATCEPPASWNPIEWACPQGWTLRSEEEVEVCDPFPDEAPAECEPAEARFPGDASCAPVGSPCPEGDFATDLPPGVPVVYVQPGASGDGTRPGSPYGSLDDVPFASLPASAVVALSKGEHSGPLRLSDGDLTIWGACARETVVRAVGPAETGTVRIVGSGGSPRVVLRNLQIAEGPQPGLVAEGQAIVELRGVVIRDAVGAGIDVGPRATVIIRDAVLRGTRTRADETGGDGLRVREEGRAIASRVRFEANQRWAVSARGLADVSLEDVVVRGTSPEAVQLGGGGLGVFDGARGRVARAAFEANVEVALSAQGAGSSLILEDLVVRGTQADRDGRGGGAVRAGRGTSLALQRASLERNRDYGVRLESTASAVLANVLIRGTESRERDGQGGYGLIAEGAEDVELVRAVFDRNRTAAVLAVGEGSDLELTDVRLRRTRSRAASPEAGHGLVVGSGARVGLVRTSFEQNRDASLVVEGARASLDADQILIRGTRSREADLSRGWGLWVHEGGTAALLGATLDRSRDRGVRVEGVDSHLELEASAVRDTVGRELDLAGGWGLEVLDGGSAEIFDVSFERHQGRALFASGPGTRLRFSGGSVRDTASTGRRRTEGWGLGVEAGASAEVRGVVFERNRELALFATGAETSLVVEDSRVANTQSRDGDGTLGRGLEVRGGASTEVRRTIFDRNFDIALFVHGENSSLSVEDTIVRETQSRISDGAFGRGLGAGAGARVEARRVIFDGNRDFGVLVTSSASAALGDLLIRGTQEPSCDACRINGTGLGVLGGGQASASRVVLRDSEQCGIYVSDCDAVDLDEVLFVDHELAACVEREASDPAPCLSKPGVVYLGNDEDVVVAPDASWDAALPVPVGVSP